jgi:GNAT superfamily N-acetyltransferase
MEKIVIDDKTFITSIWNEDEYNYVCRNLLAHNIKNTNGLLLKPGQKVNLFLKSEEDKVLGGIFCDTYNYCLYIGELWIDENYRKKGYGLTLITTAENLAKELGCIFVHTSTASYQSPKFYLKMGYEVFGVLDDFPDEIKIYYLKKRL